MRTTILLAAVLISGVFAVSSYGQGAAAPAGDAKRGRMLFEKDGCYQCHGREAQGGLGTGPRLGPQPKPYAYIRQYVKQPTGQMPPYTAKVLPDKDVADIYAFLQSVTAPPPVKNIPLLNN